MSQPPDAGDRQARRRRGTGAAPPPKEPEEAGDEYGYYDDQRRPSAASDAEPYTYYDDEEEAPPRGAGPAAPASPDGVPPPAEPPPPRPGEPYLGHGVALDELGSTLRGTLRIYERFYDVGETPQGGSLQKALARGQLDKGLTCHFLGEPLQPPPKGGAGSAPRPRGALSRFKRLCDDIVDRVERRDIVGWLSSGTTHKVAKAFRARTGDATVSALCALWNVLEVIEAFGVPVSPVTQIGRQAGLDVGPSSVPTPLSTEDGFCIAGMEAAQTANEHGLRDDLEHIRQLRGKRAVRNAKYEAAFTRKLGDLEHEDEVKAAFIALARAFAYYMPKVDCHFRECGDAYRKFYEVTLEGDDLDEDGRDAGPTDVDLASKLKNCDDVVDLARRAYRLYHEIDKLKRYLQPLTHFLRVIAGQAQGFQDYWADAKLHDFGPALEGLVRFDRQAHRHCVGTHFCYGRKKVYRNRLRSPDANTRADGGEVAYLADHAVPHDPMVFRRTPWLDPKDPKRAYRGSKKWWLDDLGERKRRGKEARKQTEKALKKWAKQFEKQQKELDQDRRKQAVNEKNWRIRRFLDAAKRSAGAGAGDAGERFERLLVDVGLHVEYKGPFRGKLRWIRRYMLPSSKTQALLRLAVLGLGIGVSIGTGGMAAGPILAAWASAKIAGSWMMETVTDAAENAWDKRKLYGDARLPDEKRMRLHRNRDASQGVVAHLLSAIKNYCRIEAYRNASAPLAGGQESLRAIRDCDDLAQYVWAVFKLRHHAVKTVEYARPLLDFAMTCRENLQHWEMRFRQNIDRCMQACHEFVARDRRAHTDTCGVKYKKEDFVLARQLSNVANLGDLKSEVCYGPPPRLGSEAAGKTLSDPRRPLDLSVYFKQRKRQAIKRLELTPVDGVDPAVEELPLEDLVHDDVLLPLGQAAAKPQEKPSRKQVRQADLLETHLRAHRPPLRQGWASALYGNNCLLHTLYQLAAGEEHRRDRDVTRDAGRTIRAWRTTLVEAGLARYGEMLYSDGAQFRAVIATVRKEWPTFTLKVHSYEPRSEQRIVETDVDGPDPANVRHILWRYQHFVPLWPR